MPRAASASRRLVLTLAETLSAHHGKKVLVIDSDAHASISTMLISPDWLATIQGQSRTFVDYLIAVVLKAERRRAGARSSSRTCPTSTMRARSICCWAAGI